MTIDVPLESSQGSILNYSIVSSDDEENPLILKLKLSAKNNLPVVALNKLEHEEKPRHAAGLKVALTPRKVQSDVDTLCQSMADKVLLKTPVKRLNSCGSDDEASPRKRTPKTPATPKRRNTNKHNTDLIITGKRQSRTPKRYFEEQSPPTSVRINLDESFRRSVLKSRYIENLKEPTSTKKPSETPNTLSKKSKKICHASTEVDDQSDKEEETFLHKRVLRSRSSSNASSIGNSFVPLSDSEDSPYKTPNKNLRMTRARRPSIQSMEVSPPKTPRTRRQTGVRQNTPKTTKFSSETFKTPKTQKLRDLPQRDSTPLMRARSQLQVSNIPTALPCREKEYQDIYGFLRGKLGDGCGGCMYISGVPGTGKTATMTSVINNLKIDKTVCKFAYVSINGMMLQEPRKAYTEIWKQLTGKIVGWEQAQSLLEQRFTKKRNQTPVVMLIDELDILCTKKQDVIYNLLDWPTKCKDQLVVITIANTMDLPERLLMSRVTSRLGLTRLTFQAYTHKQLTEIVTKRLAGTDSFHSDAIQLIARKVASISGDARRALDICRRAVEIAEAEDKGQIVNITHVNEALKSIMTQPQVMAIKRSSRLQKLLMQAIVAEIERTGVEETTFVDVFRMLVTCCALDGFKMVSSTTAQRALYQLSACKLVLTDQKCGDIYQKIILNVSVDDVYFALKKD